ARVQPVAECVLEFETALAVDGQIEGMPRRTPVALAEQRHRPEHPATAAMADRGGIPVSHRQGGDFGKADPAALEARRLHVGDVVGNDVYLFLLTAQTSRGDVQGVDHRKAPQFSPSLLMLMASIRSYVEMARCTDSA